MSRCINILAPAKLNLFLEVEANREQLSPYHQIKTVFQSIDLFDKLQLEVSEKIKPGEIEIKVLGQDTQKGVPTGKSNLIYQAAKLFWQKSDLREQSLQVVLEKQIPVAGGLAGGSSDAAATLKALNHLNGELLKQDQLLEICQILGSDIPFCYLGGCMMGTGRGDRLTRLQVNNNLLFVVVFPPADLQLSASQIYQNFDQLNYYSNPPLKFEKFVKKLLSKEDISNEIFNSLEESVIQQSYWVEQVKSLIESAGFTSLVSGSGPTVFTIMPDLLLAQKLVGFLSSKNLHVQIHQAIDRVLPFKT